MSDRVVVQQASGRGLGRRCLARRGQALLVGRRKSADLAVPHDDELAARQFRIEWRDTTPWLVSLARGTHLDGLPCEAAPLGDGQWLRAGATDFVVHVGPPPAPLDRPNAAALDALGRLRADPPRYAVLDGARDERIATLLLRGAERHDSLYEGAPMELRQAGPFLVELTRSGEMLEWLVLEGWGKSWGVLVDAEVSFEKLRRHLRRYLLVEVEGEKKRAYLRFYDPRVLRVLAPTFTVLQRTSFFGGMTRVRLEGADGGVVTLHGGAP